MPVDLANDIPFLITRNPVTFTITRTTRTPNGAGGYVQMVTTHGPYEGRIAERTRAVVTEVPTLAGRVQTDRGWILLVRPDVTLKAGVTVEDRFEAEPYGTFRITEVRPIRDGTVVYGWLADLERLEGGT